MSFLVTDCQQFSPSSPEIARIVKQWSFAKEKLRDLEKALVELAERVGAVEEFLDANSHDMEADE